MGWGPDAVVLVKTDAHHRMDVDDLTRQARELREQGKQLLAVVGSACTTSAGAYDPLDRIAEWAHTEEVWFHVDGAHGAPAGFSDTHKHLVRGMSLADSVVLDFHKVCGLPALLTGVLYRDGQESFLPFVQEAEYLWERAEGQDWWDTGKRTFECTKRMLSTRLATAMFDGGLDKWGHLVDRLWSLAEVFADEVESRSGWELAMAPQANIVCFRPSVAAGRPPREQVEGAPLEGRGQLRCGHPTERRSLAALHVHEPLDRTRRHANHARRIRTLDGRGLTRPELSASRPPESRRPPGRCFGSWTRQPSEVRRSRNPRTARWSRCCSVRRKIG